MGSVPGGTSVLISPRTLPQPQKLAGQAALPVLVSFWYLLAVAEMDQAAKLGQAGMQGHV